MNQSVRFERGFSFVELVVVTAIMVVLSGIVVAGLDRTQTFATAEMSQTAASVKSSMSMERMRRDLSLARVDEPISSGTRVRFMMPVDHDGDGFTYTTAGEVTWGYSMGGVATLGQAAWLEFFADQIVTEANVSLDLNLPGDQNDSFQLGHIDHRFPNDTRVSVTGRWVLQPLGNPGGDMDGDGTPDPLFAMQETERARLVRFRFTGLHRSADGSWQRSNYDATIRLQNDAP